MKPTALFISGWAHGLDAIRPMGDALAGRFDVQLRTGAQVLKERAIPEADYIVTGSMGGLLAIELLPERCSKLVLISSTARFCATADYRCGTHEKILRRMMLQLEDQPDAVLEAFYKNVHYPHAPVATRPGCSREELAAGLEYLRIADVREKVPQIGLPVLLLHGADDRIIPAAATEWLHDHLPESKRILFENDGHALPAHHFVEVMDEISRFL
jgi:pimeloyl-[acyl-carrier protein] methyl ester esterase